VRGDGPFYTFLQKKEWNSKKTLLRATVLIFVRERKWNCDRLRSFSGPRYFFRDRKYNCEKRWPFSGILRMEVGNQSIFGELGSRSGTSGSNNSLTLRKALLSLLQEVDN
jgi:hypothetical protein